MGKRGLVNCPNFDQFFAKPKAVGRQAKLHILIHSLTPPYCGYRRPKQAAYDVRVPSPSLKSKEKALMQASHDTDTPKTDSEPPEFPHLPYRMPALFIGHGSPMNAIEDSEFSRAWAEAGQSITKPKAILCISAHWETTGTRVTAMERPCTIHDFHGFPKPLFDMEYPAPGDPALARLIRESVADAPIILDSDWGLDHGAWSVLCRMFPQADIPVVQLSLDRTKEPAFHYGLGKSLRELRNRGILIVGSGNIVHNLGAVVWQDTSHDWALAFDQQIKRLIASCDRDAIIHYDRLGDAAKASVPTAEHFLPLLYILGLQEAGEESTFFNEKVTLGAISMTSLQVGGDYGAADVGLTGQDLRAALRQNVFDVGGDTIKTTSKKRGNAS